MKRKAAFSPYDFKQLRKGVFNSLFFPPFFLSLLRRKKKSQKTSIIVSETYVGIKPKYETVSFCTNCVTADVSMVLIFSRVSLICLGSNTKIGTLATKLHIEAN